jgi:ribosome-binding factor A
VPFFASVFSYNGGQSSGRLNTVSDGLFNNEKDTPMRKPARGYARVDRVKEQIMRELAELVRTGLKDPRAGFITINDVEVTRDYSHATVYYTVLDDKAREVTAEALEHAKGFLRSELSKRITVFRTPELHFEYDESVERGMSISQLIDEVAAEKPVDD